MTRLYSLLLTASLSLTLFGCPSGDPFTADDFECNDDRGITCAPGFLCIDFTCREVCNRSADCDAAMGCIDGYCQPYASECSTTPDCVEGYFCDIDFCRKLLGNGRSCDGPAFCLSTNCVDGVCCNESCTGECRACSIDKTGTDDGTCDAVLVGTDLDQECDGALACDGASACFAKTVGASCAEPYECDTGVCDAGFCADAVCGDSNVGGSEDCDDGNTVDDGNGCDAGCNQNNTCGDSAIEDVFEACDDGNTVGGDYCSADCTAIIGFCGDTVTQTNEDCDNGTNDGSYGTCMPDCSDAPRCGDGDRDTGDEACDDGNTADGDYCSGDCQTATGSCGDGTVQANEACDDGGTTSFDGCSNVCEVETGFKCFGSPSDCAFIIYVDEFASGSNNGTSWTNAFTDLQDALAVASAGDDIWVAAGTYVPGPARTDTFQLLDGVRLFGGFAGGETSRQQRDWVANETILSGDINGNDGPSFANTAENSYHVLTVDAGTGRATIDGISISGGNADTPGVDYKGGGIIVLGGAVEVRNSRIKDNAAGTPGNYGFGGGIYLEATTTLSLVGSVVAGNLSRCSIFDSCLGGGGGLYVGQDALAEIVQSLFVHNLVPAGTGSAILNSLGSIRVVDSAFLNNTSLTGVITNIGATALLINVTVAANEMTGDGGALHNASAIMGTPGTQETVVNSIVWGNTNSSGSGETAQLNDLSDPTDVTYSCIQDWSGGGATNTGEDPNLVNPAGGNIQLQAGSSAANTGDNTALPLDEHDIDNDGDVGEALPIDLYGGDRLQNGTVDMGAAESAL